MNSSTSSNHPSGGQTEYRQHMSALEALADTLEQEDLDPEEALTAFREADEHYRAVDAILTRVEQEIDDLHREGRQGAD